MSKLLKSKFLLGVLVVAVLVVGVAALGNAEKAAAADCTITATLRVGSVGTEVSCLQSMIGVTADGKFGPMTKAAVMAWQASKGLVADGVVGAMSRAALLGSAPVAGLPAGCTSTSGYSATTGVKCDSAAAGLPAGCTSTSGYSVTTGTKCDGGSSSSNNGPLSGGAGDALITPTSVDVENEVKEGTSEKVLGFRVEAQDSDIQLSNLKVMIQNDDSASSSKRPERYLSAVEIWMGDQKVGSVDPSDMTKSGIQYSRSVSLNNAIVREGSGNRENFYVVFKALSNIDSADMNTANWEVEVSQVRFEDGTGVVLTSGTTVDNIVVGANNGPVTFTDLATSGDVKLRASIDSGSPVEGLVKVSTTSSTSDVKLLEFRLKAEGSDLTVDTIGVDLTSVGADLGLILSELRLMRGSSTLADHNTFNAALTQTVTFDLYDDLMIDEGDTETLKVVAKIKATNGAFDGVGDTIKASVSGSAVSAEDSNGDSLTGGALAGVASGKIQTLSLGDARVTNVTSSASVANNTTKPGYISFTFTVEAVEENVVFDGTPNNAGNLTWTATGTDTTLAGLAAPVLSKTSGEATLAGGNWTIYEGDTATFVLDFTFTTVDAGDDGTYRITLNNVAGLTIDKLSPSVQIAD